MTNRLKPVEVRLVYYFYCIKNTRREDNGNPTHKIKTKGSEVNDVHVFHTSETFVPYYT